MMYFGKRVYLMIKIILIKEVVFLLKLLQLFMNIFININIFGKDSDGDS